MKTIGVIGGSGLYKLDGLKEIESIAIETPFGSPSDDLVVGRIPGWSSYPDMDAAII